MAIDLSICLCIRDNNLDYLVHLFEGFRKFFPQAEYILCYNCSSKPILNYISSVKDLNSRVFKTNVPIDRLDYMYKIGADNSTKQYILFIPHHRIHLFSAFPKELRSKMINNEEFVSVFQGKNFFQSSILLCKTSIFQKYSFSLSPDFLTRFLSIPDCCRTITCVDWYDYFCEKKDGLDVPVIQLPEDIQQNLSSPENSGRKEIEEVVSVIPPTSISKIKNVLVITTDPYPIEENYCPADYLDRAMKTTAPGLRSWSMVNWLHNNGINVTLGCIGSAYVHPTRSYKFPIVNIEKEDINKYSTCICQTGHSVVDYTMSKYRGNLILDCWVPSMVEYPLSLLRRGLKIPQYNTSWRSVSSDLYRVANYFLYPHERTLGLVLGTVLQNPKITINDMIESKRFIHIPYCVPVTTSFDFPQKTSSLFLDKHPSCKDKTTFCWFGGNYPWFDFEKVLFFYKKLVAVRQDVVLVLKSFNNFASLTKGGIDRGIPNLIVDNQWLFQHEKINYFSDIDYFFILGDIGFEGIFANRTRTLDICSLGSIVITDHNDVVGQEANKYGLSYLVNKNNEDETLRILNYLIDNKQEIKNKEKQLDTFRLMFSPDKHYPKILEVLV